MMQDTMVLEFPMDHNLVASHEKKADRENDRIIAFWYAEKDCFPYDFRIMENYSARNLYV